MQVYVDQHVAPVWGTPAKLVKSTGFLKGAWAMVFLDNADQPGALAYHDLTPDGLPLSKVFVKTTLDNGDLVSVSASHELVEMLVDPAINMMTTGPDPKTVYAYESADPVEALSFKVNGIPMSDFVYPAVLRGLPQGRLGAVRPDEEGEEAVPDPVRRLPDHLQERQVEPGLRLGGEEEALRAGGPARPPQRAAPAAGPDPGEPEGDCARPRPTYRRSRNSTIRARCISTTFCAAWIISAPLHGETWKRVGISLTDSLIAFAVTSESNSLRHSSGRPGTRPSPARCAEDLDAQVREVRQRDALGPKRVPQHQLVGVGPLLHDAHDPHGSCLKPGSRACSSSRTRRWCRRGTRRR